MQPRLSAAAAALLSVFPFIAAHADWEYTKWGMTPEQVIRASSGAAKLLPADQQQSNDEIKMTTKVAGEYVGEDLHLRVRFGFDTGTDQLRMVGYEVTDQSQNDKLIAWLTKKYGPPQQKSSLDAIGFDTYGWKTPDDIMLGITKGTAGFVMQSENR